MLKHLIALTAVLLTASPSWAINQCIGANGKLVFQDTPCVQGRGGPIQVKPASGRAPLAMAPATTASSSAPAQTEADRLNASVAASQKERRKLSLERRGVPDADAAVFAHRDACRAEQARLEAEKRSAYNTLRGQVYASQKASEQAASAARCDTKDRELVNDHNTLLQECQALGGCPGATPM
ncbi:hypothetical protein CCO03_18055 [Comamonas serinivorans]|uniref:DUF4124 domain-containing protein n=1 Tax=Comamonas serinivorans TaxID=1082851 RepID=A0A1Y0ERN3_9BURK|nr:hypothetical protein [Comamonas serinivorans]ARU06325.1 hypothetical protein CCO03_18055 [Comamonas serinivorans]